MPLTRVIRKMLEKDPSRRYSNARDVIDDLIDCHITHAWELLRTPATIETWRCSTGHADYELTVSDRQNRGFEVRVRRDLGAGLRQVHRSPHATLGRARQARRRLLVQLVEGRPLS
jgi:hypothetical protein